MPPRHGKSELVSKYFPTWVFEQDPRKQIILTSYEADFAASWGAKSRDLITLNGDKYSVRIRKNSRASNFWMTEEGGVMATAGIGGPVTGKGADVLIVDDPVKNAEEAGSANIRKKAWEWWQSTAYTRLHPGGCAIVVMTRWHEDDLAGRLIQEMKIGGEPWHVINLPAIANKDDDPLGRQIGQALWPERYNRKHLDTIKTAVGSYVWESLYQQNPVPPDGGLFKKEWHRHYRDLPRFKESREYKAWDEVIQSWDMSHKDLNTSDYVVGQCWGRLGPNFYLIDSVRKRCSFPETLELVRMFTKKHPYATIKLVEDKANGPAVIGMLRDSIPGFVAVSPKGTKDQRAAAVSPFFEAGNVLSPDPRANPWVDSWINELAAFPNGAYDDQVDATTQALLRMGKKFNREIRGN